jgi:hypothetical protein
MDWPEICYRVCIKKEILDLLPIPNDCDAHLTEMIQRCLSYDFSERPNFSNIIQKLKDDDTVIQKKDLFNIPINLF